MEVGGVAAHKRPTEQNMPLLWGGRRSVCGEGGDRSVTLHHGSLLRSTKQEGKVKAYKTNICGRIQSAIR